MLPEPPPPPAYAATTADGHVIGDDRAALDMEHVHWALATAYWAVGRTRAETERSWAHCHCFWVRAPDGRQVGFGRVLTDYTFRAHLGDVLIDPDRRGLGLGKALVAVILGHPALARVPHWTLTTRDAQELYTRYGFQPGTGDDGWMALHRGPVG